MRTEDIDMVFMEAKVLMPDMNENAITAEVGDKVVRIIKENPLS